MASSINPNRGKAKELWLASGKKRKLKDIAADLGEPENKVRKWKSEGKWDKGTLPKSNGAKGNENIDKKIIDAVEENNELTEKQKVFCNYFMSSLNATQSYLKAYGCSYSTANANGPALLANTYVKKELRRLREIKSAPLGGLCGEDIVELHMRIAFADITDFVEFSAINTETGYEDTLTHIENEVRVKDSNLVDGNLISEVSKGRDGVKIKLVDKQRSLHFLEKYFDLNPMDRHKKEIDNAKLDIERKRLELYSDGDDIEVEDTDDTDSEIYG